VLRKRFERLKERIARMARERGLVKSGLPLAYGLAFARFTLG